MKGMRKENKYLVHAISIVKFVHLLATWQNLLKTIIKKINSCSHREKKEHHRMPP